MTAPTDMELMLFHDGELEEPRRAEVAAWLEQSDVGKAKVAGLSFGGELVRESALARAASFDITDAVMAKAKSENGKADAVGEQAAKVTPIKSKAAPKAAPEDASGKDGGRLLLPLTALAAAAAAALFLWGRSEPKQVEVAKTEPTETAPVQPLPPTPAPAPTELEPFAKADIEDLGVQVASVNFGSRQGSVFIVGDESQGPTTAVVWVTEE